ncbi:YbhB/YbcL family Raf kinase inhibitor-like protein [Burkholderia cepacia]|uniref:YbhB/YbcL family Raf kinase inhibitor-like protein n=1 Tax=Burkholderia cepacia TaxID=292 RepID=UPI0029902A56|nr:YbhB/YbcL family Raf kinase inhibitor-like protein [Burkholderia cepacia]
MRMEAAGPDFRLPPMYRHPALSASGAGMAGRCRVVAIPVPLLVLFGAGAIARMSVPFLLAGEVTMTIVKPGFALCVAMLAAGTARAGDFSIESAELAGGAFGRAQVSDSFGCHGQNISPSIRWSGVPEGTQSYLLTMFDADAPTGSGFWHWVVADIPASAHGIAPGSGNDVAGLPAGAVPMKNDTGHVGYLGPCPPQGDTHRYVITLTALKVAKLPVEPDATPAVVGYTAHYQALAKATMTVRLSR